DPGMAPDVDRAWRTGSDAVLTKPCLPDHLLETLELVVSFERTIRLRRDHPPQRRSQVAGPPQAGRFARGTHGMRRTTMTPRDPSLSLHCPTCDRQLRYEGSYFDPAGSELEPWNWFTCPTGCGRYQYWHRPSVLRS